MARPCPPSAASLISQQGAPGDRAGAGPRAHRKEMRALGPPETGGCWEMAPSPPEGQNDPLRAEPPWLLPAAPSPIPFGPLGLLGSAQWGLHPRVTIPVQNWGAVAVPQSEWHLPTYLFPSGVAGQGWVGVPERFLCSPPFVSVLNKEML